MISSISTAPVFATSAGSKCTKAGAISGTKNKPLVCKRVGKRLLWQSLKLSVEGINGAAEIKSAKILWTQPPKFGGQQFSFNLELTCGKVMSLNGPQRYPEVRLTYFVGNLSPENLPKYSQISMVGLPILSNGGNKATYQFAGMAPLVNVAPIQVWVWVKDVDAPTCIGDAREIPVVMSEKYTIQLAECPTGGFSFSVGPVEKGLYSPSPAGQYPGYTWYRDMSVKGSFTNNSTADMKVTGEAVIGITPPPNYPLYRSIFGSDFYWGGQQQGNGILVSKGATVALKSKSSSTSATFPVFLNANFKVQWNDANLNSYCHPPSSP
jgi:hypothetical protein